MSRLLQHVGEPPDVFAVVLVEPLRPLLAGPLGQAPLPPNLADVKKIPELLSTIGLKANLTGSASLAIKLHANDAAAAGQLEQILDRLLAEMARQAVVVHGTLQVGGAAPNAPGATASTAPATQAAAKNMKQTAQKILDLCRPVRKGADLTLVVKGDKGSQLAAFATVMGVTLPAIAAARAAARKGK
jgi:hypothetical protein